MSIFFRVAALFIASAALVLTGSATAQSCHDHLRLSPGGYARATVSVRELLIPAKAWQHFEKACAIAADGTRASLFEHEAEQALAAEPAFAEIFLLRAQRLVDLRQFQEAIDAITAARKIRPQVAWASTLLAGALTNLRRYNEASAELDRAGGIESDTWQWQFEKARAETGRGNIEGALHWSARALSICPIACNNAHIIRANALQLANRRADAIVELEAYLTSAGTLTYRDQALHSIERTRAVLQQENAHLVAAK